MLSEHLSTIPLSANELCCLCVLKCNCSMQETFLGVWELACLSVSLYDGVAQKKKKKPSKYRNPNIPFNEKVTLQFT